ncbi:MAG: electron transport complex subunit RsxC, partial [Rhodocyclales bacterium]|nr:electron transport complex subunit RsxC [Rhodocyclales bacterium]
RIMRDHADQVVDGARIIMHAIGAREALVGIEDNKPEATAAMRKAAAAFPEVKICPVPARYPMGSDKQLIQTLTGKEVPADARAAEVGVLVHNVSTCAAVHRAIRLGQPLVERIVTLNGGAIVHPGNIFAPLGVMIDELLAFVGLSEEPARLILGGPMMGTPLPHGRIPLVKGASGILAFDAREAAIPEAGPCIRCGSCTRACPMGLLPLEMAARIRAGDLEGATAFALSDCISCGCCAYVCPSHIPLVQYFAHAKGELAAAERARLRTEATRRLAQERMARIEREAKKKSALAARRKAERDAAKAAAAKVKASEQPQGEVV